MDLRRLRPDILLGIAATVISLCALVTTYWQTRINREWQQASVWPRLAFTVSANTDDENETATYELTLVNVGIGPALIKKVTVRYRGAELPANPSRPRLSAFFYKAAEEQKVQSGRKLRTSQAEPLPGMVIAPEKGMRLLAVNGERAYGEAIKKGLAHLEVIVEYSSVYGETWQIVYPGEGRRHVGWSPAEIH